MEAQLDHPLCSAPVVLQPTGLALWLLNTTVPIPGYEGFSLSCEIFIPAPLCKGSYEGFGRQIGEYICSINIIKAPNSSS